jgi:hypothetical protein
MVSPGPAAPRGPSVCEMLKLKWDYPVYQTTAEAKSDVTAPRVARSALSRADALKFIAGKDPRPLLVLRECARCNKTDDALLTPGYDNEKVLFLTRWFHCVKLPVDVVQSDQPFNALFPNNEAEHLFVASIDGSMKLPLESDTSRSELCGAMSQVLVAAYAKDPTPLYKDIHTLGDQLDVLDERIRAVEAKKTALMESHGADAKGADKHKVAKLDEEIAAIKKERAEKLAGFEKSAKIPLKSAAVPEKVPR